MPRPIITSPQRKSFTAGIVAALRLTGWDKYDLGPNCATAPPGGSSILVKKIQELVDKGNPDALYSLGVLHENGYCVRRDNALALALFKKAAERGNPQAQFKMGSSLARTDCNQTVNWWEKAAAQGNSDAQYNLASLYPNGCPGVPKDLVRAYMWYSIIASRGMVPNQREELGKEMTPIQISEGKMLAREWVEKHPPK